MYFFFVDGNAGPPNYPLAQVNQKQNVAVRVTSLSPPPPRFFTKKKKKKKKKKSFSRFGRIEIESATSIL